MHRPPHVSPGQHPIQRCQVPPTHVDARRPAARAASPDQRHTAHAANSAVGAIADVAHDVCDPLTVQQHGDPVSRTGAEFASNADAGYSEGWTQHRSDPLSASLKPLVSQGDDAHHASGFCMPSQHDDSGSSRFHKVCVEATAASRGPLPLRRHAQRHSSPSRGVHPVVTRRDRYRPARTFLSLLERYDGILEAIAERNGTPFPLGPLATVAAAVAAPAGSMAEAATAATCDSAFWAAMTQWYLVRAQEDTALDLAQRPYVEKHSDTRRGGPLPIFTTSPFRRQFPPLQPSQLLPPPPLQASRRLTVSAQRISDGHWDGDLATALCACARQLPVDLGHCLSFANGLVRHLTILTCVPPPPRHLLLHTYQEKSGSDRNTAITAATPMRAANPLVGRVGRFDERQTKERAITGGRDVSESILLVAGCPCGCVADGSMQSEAAWSLHVRRFTKARGKEVDVAASYARYRHWYTSYDAMKNEKTIVGDNRSCASTGTGCQGEPSLLHGAATCAATAATSAASTLTAPASAPSPLCAGLRLPSANRYALLPMMAVQLLASFQRRLIKELATRRRQRQGETRDPSRQHPSPPACSERSRAECNAGHSRPVLYPTTPSERNQQSLYTEYFSPRRREKVACACVLLAWKQLDIAAHVEELVGPRPVWMEWEHPAGASGYSENAFYRQRARWARGDRQGLVEEIHNLERMVLCCLGGRTAQVPLWWCVAVEAIYSCFCEDGVGAAQLAAEREEPVVVVVSGARGEQRPGGSNRGPIGCLPLPKPRLPSSRSSHAETGTTARLAWEREGRRALRTASEAITTRALHSLSSLAQCILVEASKGQPLDAASSTDAGGGESDKSSACEVGSVNRGTEHCPATMNSRTPSCAASSLPLSSTSLWILQARTRVGRHMRENPLFGVALAIAAGVPEEWTRVHMLGLPPSAANSTTVSFSTSFSSYLPECSDETRARAEEVHSEETAFAQAVNAWLQSTLADVKALTQDRSADGRCYEYETQLMKSTM